MKYSAILSVLVLLLLVGSVSAAFTPNYTPIINKTDILHVNQSYIIADQNAISWPEWLFEVTLGLVLFILSSYFSTKPECRDIDAIFSAMSCLPLFVAAFTCTAIDHVTGYGATSVWSTQLNAPIFYLIENHTIYHFDITGIVLWIFSMIATLNTIRIVVNHRKFDQMFQGKGET
jgi:hypothetical protein